MTPEEAIQEALRIADKLKNDYPHCNLTEAKADLTLLIGKLTQESERLKAALTPSTETKADYIGEFHFYIAEHDEGGNYLDRKITVPWTTVKEIMQKIKDKALNPVGGKADV